MVCNGLADALALGIIALGVHRCLVLFVVRRMKLDDEELMLGALAALLPFSTMAYLLDLPFLVGAFFCRFCYFSFSDEWLGARDAGFFVRLFLALFHQCRRLFNDTWFKLLGTALSSSSC